MKNFLFICGCGRSGTTAIGSLIGAHGQIAMGIERFHNLVIPRFKLTKNHFIKSRFFDFQEKDSHVDLSIKEDIRQHYEQLEKRYENCTYFGDKIPLLYQDYEALFENFENPTCVKIVFVYRNVIDVLNSYNIRFKDKHDKWKRDINVGLDDWNNALSKTDQQIDAGKEVFLLQYEKLYQTDPEDTLKNLFDFIGLPADNKVRKLHQQQLRESTSLEEERAQNYSLTEVEEKMIRENAHIQLYEKFLKRN